MDEIAELTPADSGVTRHDPEDSVVYSIYTSRYLCHKLSLSRNSGPLEAASG